MTYSAVIDPRGNVYYPHREARPNLHYSQPRTEKMGIEFKIEAVRGKRSTLVNIWSLNTLMATGEAICHPDDEFDEQVGIELALGRALISLGNKSLKAGNSVVKQRDNDRQQRERAQDRKVAEPQGVSFERVPLREGYALTTEKGSARCQGTTGKGTQCKWSTQHAYTDFCAWH